ncbi:hypothetical protein N8208_01880 [Planktomarina temperata]|nr:hypothetical protein [Planktomarina temperata]
MIIFCNGSFKTGSTVLYNAVKQAFQTKSIPKRLKNDWINESVNFNDVPELCRNVDKDHVYVLKTHFYNAVKLQHLLDKFKDYVIINTDRDIEDILISSYFHFLRQGFKYSSFDQYCKLHGYYVLKRHQKYLLDFSNEALITKIFHYDEFTNQIEKVLDILGKELNLKKCGDFTPKNLLNIDELRAQYSESMGEQTAEGFFQKSDERKARKINLMTKYPDCFSNMQSKIDRANRLKSFVLRKLYGIQ